MFLTPMQASATNMLMFQYDGDMDALCRCNVRAIYSSGVVNDIGNRASSVAMTKLPDFVYFLKDSDILDLMKPNEWLKTDQVASWMGLLQSLYPAAGVFMSTDVTQATMYNPNNPLYNMEALLRPIQNGMLLGLNIFMPLSK